VKRAQLFRELLESWLRRPLGSAFVEKRRSAGKMSGNLLAGGVADATVLVVDDLVSTGGTMVRAAQACLEHGARQVYGLAAHGLFTANAGETLAHPSLARICITDTIPPFRLDVALVRQKVDIVGAAPLFAEAIRRLAMGGSISDLLERPD
jgi:ribose-phosphate pyrophosphokinase